MAAIPANLDDQAEIQQLLRDWSPENRVDDAQTLDNNVGSAPSPDNNVGSAPSPDNNLASAPSPAILQAEIQQLLRDWSPDNQVDDAQTLDNNVGSAPSPDNNLASAPSPASLLANPLDVADQLVTKSPFVFNVQVSQSDVLAPCSTQGDIFNTTWTAHDNNGNVHRKRAHPIASTSSSVTDSPPVQALCPKRLASGQVKTAHQLTTSLNQTSTGSDTQQLPTADTATLLVGPENLPHVKEKIAPIVGTLAGHRDGLGQPEKTHKTSECVASTKSKSVAVRDLILESTLDVHEIQSACETRLKQGMAQVSDTVDFNYHWSEPKTTLEAVQLLEELFLLRERTRATILKIHNGLLWKFPSPSVLPAVAFRHLTSFDELAPKLDKAMHNLAEGLVMNHYVLLWRESSEKIAALLKEKPGLLDYVTDNFWKNCAKIHKSAHFRTALWANKHTGSIGIPKAGYPINPAYHNCPKHMENRKIDTFLAAALVQPTAPAQHVVPMDTCSTGVDKTVQQSGKATTTEPVAQKPNASIRTLAPFPGENGKKPPIQPKLRPNNTVGANQASQSSHSKVQESHWTNQTYKANTSRTYTDRNSRQKAKNANYTRVANSHRHKHDWYTTYIDGAGDQWQRVDRRHRPPSATRDTRPHLHQRYANHTDRKHQKYTHSNQSYNSQHYQRTVIQRQFPAKYAGRVRYPNNDQYGRFQRRTWPLLEYTDNCQNQNYNYNYVSSRRPNAWQLPLYNYRTDLSTSAQQSTNRRIPTHLYDREREWGTPIRSRHSFRVY
jgi:hypothetical protein